MRIIAFIEAGDVIEKILRHLGLSETQNRDPPVPNPTFIPELTYVVEDYSQVPPGDHWLQ